MGMTCVYMAVEDSRLEELWSIEDDESFRDAFVDLENDESVDRLNIEKIWDALHCTLTGQSASDPIEGDSLSESIVGIYPREFSDDDDSMYVSIIDQCEIEELLSDLKQIDNAKLADQIDLKNWKENNIYPSGIWEDPLNQLTQELNTAVQDIVSFFEKTAAAENHIVVSFL